MATANHHKVVIVGGGAAGIAVAVRLTKQVDDIVVIDPSEKHYYQPLWTLVGGGCVKRETTERNESSVIPKGVTWIKDAVTTFDPDNNSVQTAEGKTIGYDVMVVCPGIQLTSEELGGRLFDSLHGQLPTLPNSARVYPGHGAGSPCGKNLSTETWSTIGARGANNYALAPMTKGCFVEVLTGCQNVPAAYFSYDASLNSKVRPVFDGAEPVALNLAEALARCDAGAVVIDTRDPNDFAAGHLKGSFDVGLAGWYAEFVGGVIEPERAIVLVGDDGTAPEATTRLARIGCGSVVGYLEHPLVAFEANPEELDRSSRVNVSELERVMGERDDLQLIDIRQPGETAGGVIEGALLIPLTRLNEQLDALDASKPTVIYCAVGFRSSIAVSRMKAAGFGDVSDLLGGYNAWTAARSAALVS